MSQPPVFADCRVGYVFFLAAAVRRRHAEKDEAPLAASPGSTLDPSCRSLIVLGHDYDGNLQIASRTSLGVLQTSYTGARGDTQGSFECEECWW